MKETLVDFLVRLYSVYVDLHFAYLAINPRICLDAVECGQPTIHYLDMAAKLDETAESICGPKRAIARDLSVYETAPQSVKGKRSLGGVVVPEIGMERKTPSVDLTQACRHELHCSCEHRPLWLTKL
ncbi:unnamed protein product [Peniophora sp. CBMAI 1063]|nr:unnamed protein product [Peniophora sp. CBMAI 1063]